MRAVRSLFYATFFRVHKFALLKIFVSFQSFQVTWSVMFRAHVKRVSERIELTPCKI